MNCPTCGAPNVILQIYGNAAGAATAGLSRAVSRPPSSRAKQSWQSTCTPCCNQIRCRERNGVKTPMRSNL